MHHCNIRPVPAATRLLCHCSRLNPRSCTHQLTRAFKRTNRNKTRDSISSAAQPETFQNNHHQLRIQTVNKPQPNSPIHHQAATPNSDIPFSWHPIHTIFPKTHHTHSHRLPSLWPLVALSLICHEILCPSISISRLPISRRTHTRTPFRLLSHRNNCT